VAEEADIPRAPSRGRCLARQKSRLSAVWSEQSYPDGSQQPPVAGFL